MHLIFMNTALAGKIEFEQCYTDIRKQLIFVYSDADFRYVTLR